MEKNIFYAYPTSEVATEKGYHKSGCWYLEIGDIAVCASLSKEDCLIRAERYIAVVWGLYSMHEEFA